MRLLRTLKRLRHINMLKPAITISVYGTATDKPHVHVYIQSHGGSQGLYSYPDDDAGNAHVEMLARTLEHITGFPVRDNRAEDRWELRGYD